MAQGTARQAVTMLLLDLPAEIVQHILYLLDSDSFYLCLLTSKLFREHAVQSRKLLLDHLSRIPVHRMLSSAVRQDASMLLDLFSKQAAKHLTNGVQNTVDNHAWKASPSMNRSLSRLVRWSDDDVCGQQHQCYSHDQHWCAIRAHQNRELLMFLEVRASDGIIKVHNLESNLAKGGHPRLLYKISIRNLALSEEAYNTFGYHIAKIAWKGVCACLPAPILGILLRATRQPYNSTILLVVELDPRCGPRVIAEYDIQPPSKGSTVAAMVIDGEANPTITWRNHAYSYECTSYASVTDKVHNAKYLTEVANHTFPVGLIAPERIADMRVELKKLLFYPASVQMPFWTGQVPGRTLSAEDRVAMDDIDLPEGLNLYHATVHGIHIAHHHEHMLTDNDLNSGQPTCINTALKLVICHKDHHTNAAFPTRKGVFILKAVEYPERCEMYNPYGHHPPMEHLFVASLVNTPQLNNLPTSGLKASVSPNSHRIALAAWRTLSIYSINPYAFLSTSHCYGGYAPHVQGEWGHVPGDYAFINACGWDYYKSAERDGTCVVLEPVDIECKGVVHALQWKSEDELWALTDEGICVWDVGVWANGRRGVDELGCGEKVGLGLTRKGRVTQ